MMARPLSNKSLPQCSQAVSEGVKPWVRQSLRYPDGVDIEPCPWCPLPTHCGHYLALGSMIEKWARTGMARALGFRLEKFGHATVVRTFAPARGCVAVGAILALSSRAFRPGIRCARGGCGTSNRWSGSVRNRANGRRFPRCDRCFAHRLVRITGLRAVVVTGSSRGA